MKPSELPAGKDVHADAALRKVTGWKLENSDTQIPTEQSLAFVETHMSSFFEGMRRAFKLIDHKAKPDA